MKSGILWLMLAVSVLFNVFFVAGYMQARSEQAGDEAVATAGNNENEARGESSEDRMTRMVTRELDLTPEQQDVFAQLHHERSEDAQEFRASIELLQRQVMRELEKPEPDVDAMQRLAEQQGELHRRSRQLEAGRFSRFVEVLSPDQREKLLRHMRGGPDGRRHRGGPERLLRMFDKNEDGTLNEQETAAAQEWQQQREHEWQQERDWLYEQFDVNRDGELDESEQKAVREWRRERREREIQRFREKFDVNNDGQLDEQEQAALEQAKREMRRNWRPRDHHRNDDNDEHREPNWRDGKPGPGRPDSPPPSQGEEQDETTTSDE